MTRVTNRELWTALSLYGDPAVAGATEPKARRANAHPEQGVLNSVMALLRAHPKVAWCVRMNSGAYKTPDGRFVRFGFPGCPDVIGQMKPIASDQPGGVLALEVKSDAGRVTPEQRAMIDKITRNNGCAGVVRSVDDCESILEAYALRFRKS